MKFLPVYAPLLAAVQLDAEQPVARLAKRCKLPTHVVHYHLRKLHEQGIIRRGAIVNHFRCGLQQWQIYLSLSPRAFKQRASLFAQLRRDSHVYWLAELGGDFHCGLSVTVASPDELPRFLSKLGEKFGARFTRKSFSQVLSYTVFPKKYLFAQYSTLAGQSITVDASAAPMTVDTTDRAILGVLADAEVSSSPLMAKKLGIPRSTFEYRLKKMKESRLVERQVYYINARLLGFLTFRIVISLRGYDEKAKEAIRGFAKRDPNIVFLVECVGSSDFELVAEVSASLDVNRVLERLYIECGEDFEDIKVLPVFEQSTSTAYLKGTAC